MDRKSLFNRSRRNTIMPVRMRMGGTKKKQILPINPSGKSTNKENEAHRTGRNLMSNRPPLSSKFGNNSKGYGPHSSITRRLSFTKNDSEVSYKSPNAFKLQENISISSVASSDYTRTCDESLLYPMNSMSTVSICSPFSSDFVDRTVQKTGYSSSTTPFTLLGNNHRKSASSTPKVSLPEETKVILKKLGIDPDCPNMPPQKLKKSTPTIVENITECDNNQKGTQTSPHLSLCMDKGKLSGKDDGILVMVKEIRSIHLRQIKELEELNLRHRKEMENAISSFQELVERDEPVSHLKSEPNWENYGKEMKTSTFQSASKVASVAVTDVQNDLHPLIMITKGPLISPVQKCSAGENSCAMTAELNSQEGPKSIQDAEIETKDTDSVPPSQVVVDPIVGDLSRVAAVSNDFQTNMALCPKSQLNQLRITPRQQNWRKREISFLETPQSGKWLVTEADDDLSFENTPTLGLNSLLKGMTIDGHTQELMETPATRRLVTKRILKGVESLFY